MQKPNEKPNERAMTKTTLLSEPKTEVFPAGTYALDVYVSDAEKSQRLLFIERVVFTLRPSFKILKHEFRLPDGDKIARPQGAMDMKSWESGIKNWLFRRSNNPFMVSREDDDDGSTTLHQMQSLTMKFAAGASDESDELHAKYPSPWSLIPSQLSEEDKDAAKMLYVLEEM